MRVPSVRDVPEHEYEVTPLELFFDLVFVFAVAQLSRHLLTQAVANELVISHPQGQGSPALSLLLAGGPILFLTAQGWYLRAVPQVWPRPHLIGGVALLLVGVVTLAAPPYAALILVGATLTLVAILDQR